MDRPPVLVLQHDPDDGLKLLAEPLLAAGLTLDPCMAWRGELPSTLQGFAGLIVLGSVACLSQGDTPSWLPQERNLIDEALQHELPVLGICFGAQHLAMAAGGEVRRAATPELGWHEVQLTERAPGDVLTASLGARFHAFQWHYDEVVLPEAGTLLAEANGMVQAFRVGSSAWGLQFHLEVDAGSILTWQGSAGGELEAVGVNLDQLNETTDAYSAANRARAERLAKAFAGQVLTKRSR